MVLILGLRIVKEKVSMKLADVYDKLRSYL